ncbi:MAG TPA: GMC family oxidoreductase N-terminal domain-containing protein [Candidatus Acidoferrum sp.]|nr:GMC family oxidoreductase N-terminal domain-containing protein [Candidatus Acidoferrum sp.]
MKMPNSDAVNFGERVRLNQQKLAFHLKSHYDFIVCGAGTSGSVVAARLASDLKTQVLLLEAGGSDETDLVTNPNRWPATLGSEMDWGFVAEPNPNLNGRAIRYSMGKILGGGSSINVSTWSRGHRADWDFYASESGDPSWSYEAILDLYRRRIEAWAGRPDPVYRGEDGTVHVQPAAEPHPFAFALLEGAESVGLHRFPNPNGRMMETAGGCALVDETVRDGKRQSIFRSYVYPLMARPNITVLTGALATQIVFDRRHATGIEFRYQGRTLRAAATGEVILSLGAIHTPKLLMQSGIGNESELKREDIQVIQALPGVGYNLHDHIAFGCIWENTDKAPPRVPRSQTACFWKTNAALDAPNFYAYSHQGPDASPENAARFKPPDASWSLAVGMRPKSRGSIHLTGSDPADLVKIDANYLGDPHDMRDLVAGLTLAREIGNSAALRPFTGREIAPGSLKAQDLERFFRDGLGTFWHQSGTAKMGRDATSVVDGKLRVYGVDGLRIADASILPRVTTGNTMAPCVVIGEQAAAFLQKEDKGSRSFIEARRSLDFERVTGKQERTGSLLVCRQSRSWPIRPMPLFLNHFLIGRRAGWF